MTLVVSFALSGLSRCPEITGLNLVINASADNSIADNLTTFQRTATIK